MHSLSTVRRGLKVRAVPALQQAGKPRGLCSRQRIAHALALVQLQLVALLIALQIMGIRLLVHDDWFQGPTPSLSAAHAEGGMGAMGPPDPEGLLHADLINEHLPPHVRVFAVQKVCGGGLGCDGHAEPDQHTPSIICLCIVEKMVCMMRLLLEWRVRCMRFCSSFGRDTWSFAYVSFSRKMWMPWL